MRILVAVLLAALAASVVTGLLGFWPSLRGGNTLQERRERTQLASAAQDVFGRNGALVERIRLHYLPGKALVELQTRRSQHLCLLLAENYGDTIDADDF